ncbi:sulfurtransferase [Nocardia sp. NPDC006044]|uniref:sulfurtransferase n=1 Tax=Nocardia sp. NPDC006044 TaxID=3364306 RepID=UPI0036B233EB
MSAIRPEADAVAPSDGRDGANLLPPFVSWEWCQRLLDSNSPLHLVDTRWYWDRSGRDAYLEGHIRGAVFVDLDQDLTGDRSDRDGRHPLPSPSSFAVAMSKVGISRDTPTVAYDDAGGVIAARLVWMLRAAGALAAVLSGGISAYRAPLTDVVPPPSSAKFEPRAWPSDRLASADQIQTEGWTLLDARPGNRYRGEDPEVDPRLGVIPQADPRAGHIPGAVNLPCRSHLSSDDRIITPDRLRTSFATVGVTPGTDPATVVHYCGAGVTACHNALAMEYAGLGVARLYPGSWSEWSRRTELPIA